MREALRAARSRRVAPALDDKRVAGWVALAVSGFARAGRLLGEPRYLEAARVSARFLLEVARLSDGVLARTWKDGEAKIPAFLEDEATLAHALLDLVESEKGERAERFLADATACVVGFARFRRAEGPGLAFTGEGHEALLTRGRDLFDKAIPSASGAAAWAQARLARRSANAALAREAAEALSEVSWLLRRSPHGTESWHLALVELLAFDGEHPEAGVGDLLALRGDGGPVEQVRRGPFFEGEWGRGRGGGGARRGAPRRGVPRRRAPGVLPFQAPARSAERRRASR